LSTIKWVIDGKRGMKTIWFAKQEKAFVCAVIFLIFMITLIPYWILLNGNLSGRRRRLQRIGDPD
jgi:hypothetical protein